MIDSAGARGSDEGPMVEVVGACKSYGSLEVLRGVSLQVDRGEVLSIIGPSGSGKTTLLRCLNGLEDIDRGAVLIDGDPIGFCYRKGRYRELAEKGRARQRTKIGMVFQSFNLFPHMNVL